MAKHNEVIKLDNGEEYFCFERMELDGKEYLYLISMKEPHVVRFAERTKADDGAEIRIIGGREEKVRLVQAFQDGHQGEI